MSASPHPWRERPAHRSAVVLIIVVLLASFGLVAPPSRAAAGNLALGRPVAVSSSEDAA
jgi:hypothetical protein